MAAGACLQAQPGRAGARLDVILKAPVILPRSVTVPRGSIASQRTRTPAAETGAAAPSEKSILDFGADPAGTKDSTAAIQSALDAGGVVMIPPGHFLISKTLDVKQSFTEIRGGNGS